MEHLPLPGPLRSLSLATAPSCQPKRNDHFDLDRFLHLVETARFQSQAQRDQFLTKGDMDMSNLWSSYVICGRRARVIEIHLNIARNTYLANMYILHI